MDVFCKKNAWHRACGYSSNLLNSIRYCLSIKTGCWYIYGIGLWIDTTTIGIGNGSMMYRIFTITNIGKLATLWPYGNMHFITLYIRYIIDTILWLPPGSLPPLVAKPLSISLSAIALLHLLSIVRNGFWRWLPNKAIFYIVIYTTKTNSDEDNKPYRKRICKPSG